MGARMLAYAIIIATAIAGLLGLSWWAAIACGSLLALISVVENQRWESQLLGRYRNVTLNSATLVSLANGCVAGAAAYFLGISTGVLWGA